MNKIRTYEDLLQEEQQLQSQLKSMEAVIKDDIAGVKEHLKPVGRVINMLNRITTRDHSGPLANFGIDFGIDILVRKFLLAKAGWFTKILIPYIIKNYSSHFINEQQRSKLMQKINDLFKKIRPRQEARAARPQDD